MGRTGHKSGCNDSGRRTGHKSTCIDLENLEESVSVMYPLMEPALEELTSQILETQSLDNISYAEDRQYTSMLLLDAIASSLEQAKNPGAEAQE